MEMTVDGWQTYHCFEFLVDGQNRVKRIRYYPYTLAKGQGTHPCPDCDNHRRVDVGKELCPQCLMVAGHGEFCVFSEEEGDYECQIRDYPTLKEVMHFLSEIEENEFEEERQEEEVESDGG